MTVRLGRVLYWAGVFLAAVFVLFALYTVYEAVALNLRGWSSSTNYFAQIAVLLGTAVACFLAGKGARYLLSNE